MSIYIYIDRVRINQNDIMISHHIATPRILANLAIVLLQGFLNLCWPSLGLLI